MRCYGEVVIRAHPLHKPVAFAIELHGPGRYPLPCGGCLAVTPVDLLSAESAAEEGDRRVVFDLDDVPFPWLVRSFVPGDRLRPAGMTGTKKVKDLFMERKVPRSYRGRIPLLFQGERLLWVCGLRRSVHAVADSRTRNPVMAEFLGEIP